MSITTTVSGSIPRIHPHAVHQARVATRRLRSDLKTFRPILDPVWLSHASAELKWLGNRLGQVRDADVLARGLKAGSAGLPSVNNGAQELRARLAEQRRGFSAELAEAMNGDRYLNLLERLHASAYSPPFYVDGYPLRDLGRSPGADDRARSVVPALTRIQWKRLQGCARQDNVRVTNSFTEYASRPSRFATPPKPPHR